MLPCGSASMSSTVNGVSQAIVSASPRLMVDLPTPPFELMTAAAVPERSVGVMMREACARHKVRVEYHRGHSKNPMTDGEMEEKFRGLAKKHLKADRVDALLKLLWSLDSQPKIDPLLALTKV
jgi:2-methylcitrate dehydratase